MRAMLADASLARFARQFVWLELDFDKPVNQEFLARHGVAYTPTFFVLDPTDERATVTQLGGMTLPELNQFLERGASALLGNAKAPADASLARGDEMLALGKSAEAATAYSESLRLGGSEWPQHDRAMGSLTWALMMSEQTQACAETAVAEAPHIARGQIFGRVVLSGITCVNQGKSAPWAEAALKPLERLAAEAIALPATLRDHRFQLYQQLMHNAELRGDKATVSRWGERWLEELDAAKPLNDDERSALDVARVDAAGVLGDPARVLPALIASERAMPANYNASLRLAQMATEAKQYDQAIAACNRGLLHVNGPTGRAWLLKIKADALQRKGQPAEAKRALEAALQSAQAIGQQRSRERNIETISKALKELETAAK